MFNFGWTLLRFLRCFQDSGLCRANFVIGAFWRINKLGEKLGEKLPIKRRNAKILISNLENKMPINLNSKPSITTLKCEPKINPNKQSIKHSTEKNQIWKILGALISDINYNQKRLENSTRKIIETCQILVDFHLIQLL